MVGRVGRSGEGVGAQGSADNADSGMICAAGALPAGGTGAEAGTAAGTVPSAGVTPAFEES